MDRCKLIRPGYFFLKVASASKSTKSKEENDHGKKLVWHGEQHDTSVVVADPVDLPFIDDEDHALKHTFMLLD